MHEWIRGWIHGWIHRYMNIIMDTMQMIVDYVRMFVFFCRQQQRLKSVMFSNMNDDL